MSISSPFAPRPRIGILGAGALGAFYGARLARAGHDVHFLMRRDYETVRENGLTVRSFEGDFHLPQVPVYRTPEHLGPCDILIVAIKSTQNKALPALLAPTVHPNTIILTMQNGLGNEEAIAAVLSTLSTQNSELKTQNSPAVMGAIAFLCSNRIAPGVIHHMDHGWIRIAELQSPARDRTHAVAELFRSAGIHCEVYESLAWARWEKLVWNVPFNGLGVAAGANTAEVLADPELLELARALMDEVVQVAHAADHVDIAPDLPEKMINNTRTMGEYRSSMQIDHEEGRPVEVEAILGEPVRRARRAQVPAPRLQMLYATVRALNTRTPYPAKSE